MAKVVQTLRPYLLGWKAYFGLSQTPKVWRRLDEWLRHRLRAIQRKHWKRGRTIYRELRALGAPPGVAQRVAANSRCWWRNSGKLLNSVRKAASRKKQPAFQRTSWTIDTGHGAGKSLPGYLPGIVGASAPSTPDQISSLSSRSCCLLLRPTSRYRNPPNIQESGRGVKPNGSPLRQRGTGMIPCARSVPAVRRLGRRVQHRAARRRTPAI